jgi:hypothetical protein
VHDGEVTQLDDGDVTQPHDGSEPGLHLVTENGQGPVPAAADAGREPGSSENGGSPDGPDA